VGGGVELEPRQTAPRRLERLGSGPAPVPYCGPTSAQAGCPRRPRNPPLPPHTCLVMLKWLMRPPVSPAAATQLPQLEATSWGWGARVWGGPGVGGARRGGVAEERVGFHAARSAPAAAGKPLPQAHPPSPAQPPPQSGAHVVQQAVLEPVRPAPPVYAQVQGQVGRHVLAAAVTHPAWGGGTFGGWGVGGLWGGGGWVGGGWGAPSLPMCGPPLAEQAPPPPRPRLCGRRL
jgi:hypothetical protein